MERSEASATKEETMPLIIADKRVEFPDHERIRDGREVGAWWARNEFGTGPRAGDTDILTVHWTAGEAGTKDPDGAGPLTQYDDDGPRVVRGMKARESKKRPGQKLQVSIPFVLGACDPHADMCPIWQTMDLAWNSAVHVGDRGVNRRSLAFEVVNSGEHGGPLDVRNREFHVEHYLGQDIEVANFFKGQMNAIAWLARVLSSHAEQTSLGLALRDARIVIPRQVPVRRGDLLAERFTPRQMRAWKGVMEHFHVPGTTKIDAGLMGLDACQRIGGFADVEV